MAKDEWTTVQGLPALDASNQAATCRGDKACPSHGVVTLGGGQASVGPLVQLAVDPQPSAFVPSDYCSPKCAAGSLCCKDPLSGPQTGSCYSVTDCGQIH